jgi:hypothetical protein
MTRNYLLSRSLGVVLFYLLMGGAFAMNTTGFGQRTEGYQQDQAGQSENPGSPQDASRSPGRDRRESNGRSSGNVYQVSTTNAYQAGFQRGANDRALGRRYNAQRALSYKAGKSRFRQAYREAFLRGYARGFRGIRFQDYRPYEGPCDQGGRCPVSN